MTQKQKSKLYHEHKRLICKIVFRYSIIYNIPFNELLSEAHHIFCKALKSYDPNRDVKFSTYLYKLLNNQLNTFCKQWIKRGYYSLPEGLSIEPEQNVNLLEEEILSSISDKAKYMLEVVQTFDLSEPPKIIKGKLRRFLTTICGWKQAEYYSTLKELKSIKF